jgi:hypothetical protein
MQTLLITFSLVYVNLSCSCLSFKDNLCDSYGARVQVMTSKKHLQVRKDCMFTMVNNIVNTNFYLRYFEPDNI